MDEPQSPYRVTALVVSRNNAEKLQQCLTHLERSTARDRLEILVVDDGSRDGTAAVLAGYPDLVTLTLPKRFGWTRANNIGLRTAKGEMILLLPVDCAVAPETVSDLADWLEAHPDAGAVCPKLSRVWKLPSVATVASAWTSGQIDGAVQVPDSVAEFDADYTGVAPMLVRRELLRGINYLDEHYGDRWADLELCTRIRQGGKRIVVLPAVRPAAIGAEARSPRDATELADSASGVAQWISRHYGFAAGVKFRIAAAFRALGSGQFGAFSGILSAQKIDGNQE